MDSFVGDGGGNGVRGGEVEIAVDSEAGEDKHGRVGARIVVILGEDDGVGIVVVVEKDGVGKGVGGGVGEGDDWDGEAGG